MGARHTRGAQNGGRRTVAHGALPRSRGAASSAYMTACRRMLVTWLESHRVWDIVFTDTPAPTRPSPCPRAVAYQYFALAMFYWRATAESCIKDDTIFTTITALVTRYPHFLIRARTRYTPCTRNGQRPVHDSRHGYASQSHSILYTAVHNRYGSYSRYTTKEFLYTAVRSHCEHRIGQASARAWRSYPTKTADLRRP